MKRFLYSSLTAVMLFLSLSTDALAAVDRTSARSNLGKARQLYELYKRYEGRSQEIAGLLNIANNFIRNSNQEMDRQNYQGSVVASNKAIELLNSIPEKLAALGGADGQITPRTIQEKLHKVRSMYDLMKRYNFNNNEINNRFALAKERIKFSQTMFQENNYRRADALLDEARKALFDIPRIYVAAAEQHQKARNNLFMAQVLADFTKRYYVNDIRTQGEYRRVIFWLNKARQYFDSQEYTRFDTSITRTQESMTEVQKLRKKIDRENNIRAKRCGDAHYMIQFAEIIRKRSTQLMQTGGMSDLFLLGRHYLKNATDAIKQGRCKEALEAATQAAKTFYKVRTFRDDVIRYKKMAEEELKKAEEAYQKAIRARLPFDAVEQVKQALNDINRAKALMQQAEYQQAYNILHGANMILKSVID